MLLAERTAVIYGGGGAIGTAVARGFAREGATVHLVGRTAGPLERAAEAVRAEGGTAHTAVVDALDEAAVEAHAETLGQPRRVHEPGLHERRAGHTVAGDVVRRLRQSDQDMGEGQLPDRPGRRAPDGHAEARRDPVLRRRR